MQQSEEGSQNNFLANTHEAQLQLREGENRLQSTWAPAVLGWELLWEMLVGSLFCLVRFAINNFLAKGLEK